MSASPASIDTGYGATFLVDPATSIKLGLPVGAGGLALPGDIPDDRA